MPECLSNEIGDISRFATPQSLASYAGTVPRVHISGGHTRYGRLLEETHAASDGEEMTWVKTIKITR
jgi:hypothetical protein